MQNAAPAEERTGTFDEDADTPARSGGHEVEGPRNTALEPGLYVVATPIGNVEDCSPRARAVLAGADLVLAEDTRRLFALARELGLRVKEARSFHDHNERDREEEALRAIRDGRIVALVSDAGTPLVADPGFRLVTACRREGLTVHPVPGPSAPVTALSGAGIPPIPHTFLGFAPRDAAARSRFFAPFARVPSTLVFFDRKDRLEGTLREAARVLGSRQVCVCRELTKSHEEFLPCRLEDESTWPRDLLGELTVIVGPPEEEEKTPKEDVVALLSGRSGEMKPRALAKEIASRVSGWSVSEIYDLLTRS